jgi:hypothetical protein
MSKNPKKQCSHDQKLSANREHKTRGTPASLGGQINQSGPENGNSLRGERRLPLGMQIQPGSLWPGGGKAWEPGQGRVRLEGRGAERQEIGGKGDTLPDGEDREEGDDDDEENGSRPVPDK